MVGFGVGANEKVGRAVGLYVDVGCGVTDGCGEGAKVGICTPLPFFASHGTAPTTKSRMILVVRIILPERC
jgi:hypothetical protein